MTDLSAMTVQALSQGLAARRFSPVDVVEAQLGRIAALEPRLQAFVHVHEKQARLAAEAADKAIRAGHGLGPLHGIPIAVKDLVEFQGHVTTAGCAVWRERVSQYSASLVQKLLAAGMVVLGKTHTVEFAYGAWGTNQHMGTPWNPWDMKTQRTPGMAVDHREGGVLPFQVLEDRHQRDMLHHIGEIARMIAVSIVHVTIQISDTSPLLREAPKRGRWP